MEVAGFPFDSGYALCYFSVKAAGCRVEARAPQSGRRVSISNERKTMSQAIMDPAEVRRFAEELKRFNQDLQSRITLLHARFAALGDTWQDQEHARFAEEFRQTMKALTKFIEISGQHTPFLLRKAQRIEEYLSQH
jgi:uncharacterized protein YukE